MTITTQTAPISMEQTSSVKGELAKLIAASSIALPKEFGCDQEKMAMIEASLPDEARELLRQVPSADRRSVLAIAVTRAVQLRK